MKEAVTIARREFHLYHECREVREEISYDQEEMSTSLNLALHGDGPQNIGKLNSGQMAVFDAIRQAIHGNDALRCTMLYRCTWRNGQDVSVKYCAMFGKNYGRGYYCFSYSIYGN